MLTPTEKKRLDLPWEPNGEVLVSTPESLQKVLRYQGQDLSAVSFKFQGPPSTAATSQENKDSCQFVLESATQIWQSGILPHPSPSLPAIGTKVEALFFNTKPRQKPYGLGTVDHWSWDSVFQAWRVGVKFDTTLGYYCGQPITGVSTFPPLVRPLSSPGRLFSDMSTAELVRFDRQFWNSLPLIQAQRKIASQATPLLSQKV